MVEAIFCETAFVMRLARMVYWSAPPSFCR
jgi:hypothetical protein